MEKKGVGIIGFGRFSALMCRYMANDAALHVYTPSGRREAIFRAGAAPAGLEEAAAQPVVILAVPISALCRVLDEIAPLLRPDALVADVCSVKSMPIRWMRERLPETISILGTHPMFGPDSAAASLSGRKIVLCPERVTGERFAAVKRYLETKGLLVIETDAETHDREIAVSLALTHFIGRSLEAFGARPLSIDTEGYNRLLHTLGVVSNDTWQLFEDMHRFNPHARKAREAFLDAVRHMDGRLRQVEGAIDG